LEKLKVVILLQNNISMKKRNKIITALILILSGIDQSCVRNDSFSVKFVSNTTFSISSALNLLNPNRAVYKIDFPDGADFIIVNVTASKKNAIEMHKYREKVYEKYKNSRKKISFSNFDNVAEFALEVAELIDSPPGDASIHLLVLNDKSATDIFTRDDEITCKSFKSHRFFKSSESKLNVSDIELIIYRDSTKKEQEPIYLGLLNCDPINKINTNVTVSAVSINVAKNSGCNSERKNRKYKKYVHEKEFN